jgi:molybdopterin synthase sulfur carrier subunit
MKVKVRFFGHLCDLTGKKTGLQVDLDEDATISTLLDKLCLDSNIESTLFDESHQLKPNITILKNGREIKFLDNLDTLLSSGDEVSFFPLVAGG